MMAKLQDILVKLDPAKEDQLKGITSVESMKGLIDKLTEENSKPEEKKINIEDLIKI